jgi:hypothetical protein
MMQPVWFKYVSIYTCKHTCIYSQLCMSTNAIHNMYELHTHTYVYIYTYIHTYIHIYIYTHTHIYVSTHGTPASRWRGYSRQIYEFPATWIRNFHCLSECFHQSPFSANWKQPYSWYAFVCMNIYIYIYPCIHICIYIYMYIYIYVYTYVWMYTYIHIYVYTCMQRSLYPWVCNSLLVSV